MNKEIVIKDKFVDYAGKEHQFIVAGVKIPLQCEVVSDDNVEGFTNYGLCLGVSICNPDDTFDEKFGVLKAVGRAYKGIPIIFSQFSGQLGDNVVKAILEQECEYIQHHPEKYIGGYLEAKDRFDNNQKLIAIENKLTDIEKVIVEGIKKDSKYLDNVQEYLKYWNK